MKTKKNRKNNRPALPFEDSLTLNSKFVPKTGVRFQQGLRKHKVVYLWDRGSMIYFVQGASLRGRHTPPATLAQEGKIV